MKAAEKLLVSEGRIAAGQAYNISDDNPKETYAFFKPLFDAMGRPYPWITIPYWLIFSVSWISEILHLLFKPFFHIEPIITRNEVTKCCKTHSCSMEKAKKQLNYVPIKYEVSYSIIINF